MEISFENKSAAVYREAAHQVKRIQESMESVVPDVNDDIGKIASVQSSLLLKSKDTGPRGVTVTGELSAVLLYITEGERAVASLRLSKNFTMEFEMGELAGEAMAQVRLSVVNTEARVLNPRKVSVTVELAGELSCYQPEALPVETLPPEDRAGALHLQYETAEAVVAGAVGEKTFAVNEQYVFPAGKPSPSQLLSQQTTFWVAETENIGGRIILKGTLHIAVCYLSEEVDYPVRTEFTSPFSQLADLGEEELDGCAAIIELTSAYYDLIETIGGEKAMDAEIHAVVQLVGHRRQRIRCVTDAYSNRMPARCRVQSSQIADLSQLLRPRLSAQERISIAEDCQDVLSALSTVSQVTAAPDGFSAVLGLEILYRTRSGGLSSVRRQIELKAEGPGVPARVLACRLGELDLRPDGPVLDCRASLELCCQCASVLELSRVAAVELDEEAAYDPAAFPSVTLVRPGAESLWELAKRYRSSVERIEAMNGPAESAGGRLLLIPREK